MICLVLQPDVDRSVHLFPTLYPVLGCSRPFDRVEPVVAIRVDYNSFHHRPSVSTTLVDYRFLNLPHRISIALPRVPSPRHSSLEAVTFSPLAARSKVNFLSPRHHLLLDRQEIVSGIAWVVAEGPSQDGYLDGRQQCQAEEQGQDGTLSSAVGALLYEPDS